MLIPVFQKCFVCVYLQYHLFDVVDNVILLMTVVIAVGERERTGLFVAELVKEWLNMHLPSPEILIKEERCQDPTSHFLMCTHTHISDNLNWTHLSSFGEILSPLSAAVTVNGEMRV